MPPDLNVQGDNCLSISSSSETSPQLVKNSKDYWTSTSQLTEESCFKYTIIMLCNNYPLNGFSDIHSIKIHIKENLKFVKGDKALIQITTNTSNELDNIFKRYQGITCNLIKTKHYGICRLTTKDYYIRAIFNDVASEIKHQTQQAFKPYNEKVLIGQITQAAQKPSCGQVIIKLTEAYAVKYPDTNITLSPEYENHLASINKAFDAITQQRSCLCPSFFSPKARALETSGLAAIKAILENKQLPNKLKNEFIHSIATERVNKKSQGVVHNTAFDEVYSEIASRQDAACVFVHDV